MNSRLWSFVLRRFAGELLTTLALSSYWMSGRDWRLRDFFTAGTNLGFESFELSGIHQDTFYDEIRPGDFCIDADYHLAPGIGDVDWRGLASFVPRAVMRVLEVDCTVSANQVRAGIAHLQKNRLDLTMPLLFRFFEHKGTTNIQMRHTLANILV